MVDAYVVSNLQESLGLTDEQFVKAHPAREEAAARAARQPDGARRACCARCAAAAAGRRCGAAGDRAAASSRRRSTPRAPSARAATSTRSTRVFTPVQQAKFRVMESEVEQRMRELLNQARHARPGPRPKNAPPE